MICNKIPAQNANKHIELLSSYYYATAADTWEYTGASFTINERSLVEVRLNYNNTPVYGLGVSPRNDDVAFCEYINETTTGSSKKIVCSLGAGTYYIWGKVGAANKRDNIMAYKIINL